MVEDAVSGVAASATVLNIMAQTCRDGDAVELRIEGSKVVVKYAYAAMPVAGVAACAPAVACP